MRLCCKNFNMLKDDFSSFFVAVKNLAADPYNLTLSE
jgi:hypothetical protein